MVLGRTYANSDGKYLEDLTQTDIKIINDGKDPTSTLSNGMLAKDVTTLWKKMSKSKCNGVNPDTVVASCGADAARMAMLFKAPVNKNVEWDHASTAGHTRLLRRLWTAINDIDITLL